MGVGSFLSNAGSAIKSGAGKVGNNLAENMGAIEKAVLEIYDLRVSDGGEVNLEAVDIEGQKNRVKMAGAGNTPVMTYADQRGIRDILALASQKHGMSENGTLVTTADPRLNNPANALGAFTNGQNVSMTNITRKLYTVQFNPSSLQLSSHGGNMVRKMNFEMNHADQNGRQDNSVVYEQEETVITLRVPLLFDSCDPQDAFMFDKLNTSITEVAKGAAKLGMTLAGKKEVSIQKQVEGFIGMIRNRHTRYLTFHWGDMNYFGTVSSLSARYTMFNVTGQPVRATVDMTMYCVNKNMKESKAVWFDKYKEIYGNMKDPTGFGKFAQGAQKWTQNFLNL